MKKRLMFIVIVLLSFVIVGCQQRDIDDVIGELEDAGYIVEAKDNQYIGMMRSIKPDLAELEAEYSIYSEGDLQVAYIMVFSSPDAAQTYYDQADLGTCIKYNGVYDNFFINTLDVNLFEIVMDTTVETTLNITTE